MSIVKISERGFEVGILSINYSQVPLHMFVSCHRVFRLAVGYVKTEHNLHVGILVGKSVQAAFRDLVQISTIVGSNSDPLGDQLPSPACDSAMHLCRQFDR